MSPKRELNRCTYFLEKKKRRCRLIAKDGAKFCGEHAVFDDENTDRIPCPNDPKHSILKAELDDHLKNRCNARILPKEYMIKNINVGGCVEERGEFIRPSYEVLLRVAKIVEAENTKIENFLLNREFPVNERLKEDLRNALSGSSRKHLLQVNSIIDHATACGLLTNSPDECIVEFGSGKAQLSYWLMNIFPNINYLLIDRMGARNKFDNKAIRENNNLNVKRIRCSIEHLDLSKVDIAEKKTLTAICKHLCGNATDSAIRCVLNAQKFGLQFRGLIFAPCCHHRTTYEQYVGIEYLKSLRIDDELMFSGLRHMCSWATCGFATPSSSAAKIDDRISGSLPNSKDNEDVLDNVFQPYVPWSNDYKIELGGKAKLLMEYGRAEFLLRNGLSSAELFAYVPKSITPENILIVAKP